MQKDLKEFSATLDTDTYDKGVKVYHKLKKAKLIDQDQLLEAAKVSSVKDFKKGFKFQATAQNDNAVEAFAELDIAQQNLNNNIDNDKLENAFLEVAKKTKKTLKEKFMDDWSDPKDSELVDENADSSSDKP